MRKMNNKDLLEKNYFKQQMKLWICSVNCPVLRVSAIRYYRNRIAISFLFNNPDHQKLVQEYIDLVKAFDSIFHFFNEVGLVDPFH